MHGSNLSALCLPAACLLPARLSRMLLFFDRLYCYQPAEDIFPAANFLAETDLLQVYPPAPLGEELGRFHLQLRDMKAHADEYLQAHRAAMAQGERERTEAEWRRIAGLLRQAGPDHKSLEDELWRARLYLALAQIHAAGAREVSLGLAAINRRQKVLLQALKGEEGAGEEDADPLELELPAEILPPGRSERLLKGWSLLYLADANPERPWLLAADEEGANLLMDEYARSSGRGPEKLVSFAMPPVSGSGAEFTGCRLELRSTARDFLAGVADFLTRAAFAGTGPDTVNHSRSAAELAAEWQQITAPSLTGRAKRPAAENHASQAAGAAELVFYRFPGTSFPGLFSRFCRQEIESAGPSSPSGILAVLEIENR